MKQHGNSYRASNIYEHSCSLHGMLLTLPGCTSRTLYRNVMCIEALTSTGNDALLVCVSPSCWLCSPGFRSSIGQLSLLCLHTNPPTCESHSSADCAACEKLKKTNMKY